MFEKQMVTKPKCLESHKHVGNRNFQYQLVYKGSQKWKRNVSIGSCLTMMLLVALWLTLSYSWSTCSILWFKQLPIDTFLFHFWLPSSYELKNSSTDSTCQIKSPVNINHCSNDSTCPTWFSCNPENRCQCDKTTSKIVCDDEAQVSAVLNCNCVTYDSKSKLTYVGSCFYNCLSSVSSHLSIETLPKNPEILKSTSACTPFHRAGLLCGDCDDGYSPLVLSYNLSCVECPDGHENWWKFILAGFLPLTAFYLFILAFNINVTSSCLHGVVWYSQFI